MTCIDTNRTLSLMRLNAKLFTTRAERGAVLEHVKSCPRCFSAGLSLTSAMGATAKAALSNLSWIDGQDPEYFSGIFQAR